MGGHSVGTRFGGEGDALAEGSFIILTFAMAFACDHALLALTRTTSRRPRPEQPTDRSIILHVVFDSDQQGSCRRHDLRSRRHIQSDVDHFHRQRKKRHRGQSLQLARVSWQIPNSRFSGETYSATNAGQKGISLSGNYWHIKGLTVQYAADNGISISGSNNTVEQMVARQNQDSGFLISGSNGRQTTCCSTAILTETSTSVRLARMPTGSPSNSAVWVPAT